MIITFAYEVHTSICKYYAYASLRQMGTQHTRATLQGVIQHKNIKQQFDLFALPDSSA